MKTEVQKVSACRAKVAMEATAETIDPIYKGVRSTYTAQVGIPGFRKGKAPWEKIESIYGKNIQDEITQRVLRAFIDAAREETKLSISSVVDVENLKSAKGEGASVTLVLDLNPEFATPDTKAWQVKKLDDTIEDSEIESRLTDVRRMAATYEDATDESAVVEENDIISIAFTSDLNKDELSDGAKHYASDEDYWTQLREDAFIPGLNAQVLGKKLNEEVEFKAEFPADFKIADLAGKSVQYKVTVKKLRKQVPATDEVVLQRFQVKDIEELKQRIVENLKSSKHYTEEARATEELLAKIDETLSFELPERKLESAIYDALSADPSKPLENFKGSAEELKKSDVYKKASESATKSLRREYALQAIAKDREIKLSGKEVENALNALAGQVNMKPQDLLKRLQENGRLDDFLTRELCSKVLTTLVQENATL